MKFSYILENKFVINHVKDIFEVCVVFVILWFKNIDIFNLTP